MIDANAMNHFTVMKTTREPFYVLTFKIFVSSCLTYIISLFYIFFLSVKDIFKYRAAVHGDWCLDEISSVGLCFPVVQQESKHGDIGN